MNRENVLSLAQRLGKYKYAVGVILLGVFLMLLPSGEKKSSEAAESADPFDRLAVQQEMEGILRTVDGAGKLRLMLSVDSGSELELACDMSATEEERGSSNKTQTVVIDRGSSTEEVVVTKSRFPRFTGALIVCEGAGSASVRLNLVNAVSALTGLTADKISVVKGRP